MSEQEKEKKNVEIDEEEEEEEDEVNEQPKTETKPEEKQESTVAKEKKEDDEEDEEEEDEKEKPTEVKAVEEKPVEEAPKEEEKPVEEAPKEEEKPVEEATEEVVKQVVEEAPKEEDNKSTDSSHSYKEYDLVDCRVSAEWFDEKESVNITFKTNTPDKLKLHWGVYKNEPINCWYHPNKDEFPEKTSEFDSFALQTDFVGDDKEKKIQLKLNKSESKGLCFVFYNPDTGKWYNNYYNDFQIAF